MASVEVKGLVKTFGRVRALDGVDLSVADGEFCVLLGPSGCGKSTLLNIIAGLISQDEGSVSLGGMVVDRLYPRERDVAMVFQNYALYPHMTVAQNMGFGLKMRKTPVAAIQARVRETARLLGIENLLDRKPKALSGGQRQRVAMGRALVRRPRLFLFDEPLSNLDARLRASVRIELKQLHNAIKGTIIHVTHDQVEAMTLGDKVVVMQNGRVHQVGSPENIYDHPADTFVARFIGFPEMNLFTGDMRKGETGLQFQGPGVTLDLGSLQREVPEGEIELGIRPEDIRLDGEGDVVLETSVTLLTNIGSEKYILAKSGPAGLTVRSPKEARFRPGQVIPLSISRDHLHLFKDGKRI